MQELIEQLDVLISARPHPVLEGEGGASMNMATVSVADARVYAEKVFKAKLKKGVDEVIPNFDKNYMAVQKAVKAAVGVSRDQMPVVEPTDTKLFASRLRDGAIDLFKPYFKGKLKLLKGKQTPMAPGEREIYLRAGHEDGSEKDDKIRATIGKTLSGKMKPIQKQIWLEKVINGIADFGVPSSSSTVVKTTIIISKDGQIIDGHHRWAQAALTSPGLAMSTLKVPISIDKLLDLARTYGAAIGRGFKA